MSSDASAVITVEPRALMPVMNVEQAVERHKQMVVFVRHLMKEGRDYGTIPGTSGRSLWKAGAEKLTTFFGLTIRFVLQEKVEDWDGGGHGGEPFFYYRWNCLLSSGGRLVAEAEGSANSREAKYRYRQAKRACPICGEQVRKSKQAKNGWYCWVKTGGCGATFAVGDQDIEGQQLGRVLNPDIADQVNTILKIGQKRSLVAAVLLAVNASEFFDDEVVAGEPDTATKEELSHLPEQERNQVERDQAPPADSYDRNRETRARMRSVVGSNGTSQRGAIDWDAFFPVLANMYEVTVEQVKKRLGDLGQYQSSADAKAAMDARPGENAPQANGERVGAGWDTWSVSDRNGFWAKAGELGLPNDSLHLEMGVKSMKDYGESLATAHVILDILGYGQEQGLGLGDIWEALHVGAVCEFNMILMDAKVAIDNWAADQDPTVQQQGELAV